ncbi:MAG: hypothetical protein LBQ62_03305 [Candidatus Accumulibacter sp.]|jgi:hypothetical protein|nr:hypothetical protein [Accumulibacter sp.]
MSGPATAVFTPEGIAILLAARAIEEALQMGAEYADTLEDVKRKEAGRKAQLRQEQAASAARLAGLKERAERLEARCLRLSGLTRPDGGLPPAPAGAEAADAAAWIAYARRLEAALSGMEARLESENRAALEAVAAAGETPDLRGVLALYLAQRRAERGAAEQAAWRETVERTLARLDLPPGEALPVRIEALARAVILAETPARAELLGNELRREIHLHRRAAEQAKRDAAQAADWLQAFAAAGSLAAAGADEQALSERLQAVAAGLLPLDAATREAALRRAEEIGRAAREQEAKAAAVVLEQSLRDLGYRVETVRETLFAEGGMIHFQRPGWGGHFVRLRANAKEKKVNFNVVRAPVDAEKSDAAARKRQDFMAEERWCAEFPKLLATLAARGLKLDVTRLLEAGELPVQEVAAERLPRFESETAPERKKTLKTLSPR